MNEVMVRDHVCLEDFGLLKTCAEGFGIELGPWQLEMFCQYTKELVEWNERTNLTSLGETRQIIIQHYLDSLAPGPYLRGIKTLMDLGSGGGCPGIPLKILMPELEVCLVESRRKRASFLRDVAIRLSLENVSIYHGRAEDEELHEKYKESIDVVISRASLNSVQILRIGLGLVREGGRIVLMKGKVRSDELRDLEVFMQGAGIETRESIIPYALPGMAKRRHLVIVTR